MVVADFVGTNFPIPDSPSPIGGTPLQRVAALQAVPLKRSATGSLTLNTSSSPDSVESRPTELD
jgi:hypothetical protein